MYRNYVIIAYNGSGDKKLMSCYGSYEGAKKRALDAYNLEDATYVEKSYCECMCLCRLQRMHSLV